MKRELSNRFVAGAGLLCVVNAGIYLYVAASEFYSLDAMLRGGTGMLVICAFGAGICAGVLLQRRCDDDRTADPQ